MNRYVLAASALSSAVGLAFAIQAAPAQAAEGQAGNMPAAAEHSMQKCYGVNAVGKNDCAAGAHSCAGQATKARDPGSFVLLPAGDCSKIAGGSLKPA